MSAWGVALVVGLSGCRSGAEIDRTRRVWEMEDHAADLLAVRDAIRTGDLRAVEDAGLRLASPDPVPGLPGDALVALDAVRAGGRLLATADTRAEAADLAVAITLSCAACHGEMGISRPVPEGLTEPDRVWFALVFEVEAAWPASVPGDTWRERRAAVAADLAD